MKVKCGKCGKELTVPEKMKGEKGKCPTCGNMIDIESERKNGYEEKATKDTILKEKLMPNSVTLPCPELAAKDSLPKEHILHFQVVDQFSKIKFFLPDFGKICICCNESLSNHNDYKDIAIRTTSSSYQNSYITVPVCKLCKGHFHNFWKSVIRGIGVVSGIALILGLWGEIFWYAILAGIFLIFSILYEIILERLNNTLRKRGHYLYFDIMLDPAGLHITTCNSRLACDLADKYRTLLIKEENLSKEYLKAAGSRFLVILLLLPIAVILVLLLRSCR
jgi:hypothetical protein